MIPLQPPAQVQAPTTAQVSLAVAVANVLDAYDRGGEGAALPEFDVPVADRPALRWLRDAAARDLPGNPFAPGSAEWKEAESIRSLLQAPPSRREGLLRALTLAESGSQLAVWRWGKRLSRGDALPSPLRTAWEDALLAAPTPTLVSSYALRHALSFALATEDLARLAGLKSRCSERDPDMLFRFQRLFGFLGTPGPRFTYWRLPEMTLEEQGFGSLGGTRVWIQLMDPMILPVLPEGTSWLIPMDDSPDPSTGEAPAVNAVAGRAGLRLRAAGRRAWLSPKIEDLESIGLSYFPILIELEGANLKRIRMGDAAPASP